MSKKQFCNIFTGLFMLGNLSLGASTAIANGFFIIEDGINIAALAVGSIPEYSGSDDSETGIAPAGRYYFSGLRYAELLGPELSININDAEALQYGPRFQYRFGREDIDDDVVDKMQEIDDTYELGVFIKSSTQIGDNPLHRLNFIGDVTFDVGGEHDGYFASARVSYFRPVAKAMVFHIGGAVGYASSDFMDTYFSVDAKDAVLSGLPFYEASSGVHDYRVTFGLMQHLSPHWHIGIGGRYQRLLNDAQDSPVVDLRGDRDQWIYGVGVGYVWQ